VTARTITHVSEFHDAAPTDWVAPGETATVEVGGLPVTLANVGGDYFAFPSQCPHQGTDLGGLTLLRGRLLRCPEHGSTFDVTTGQCVLASDDGWTGTPPALRDPGGGGRRAGQPAAGGMTLQA
jgi:3-phenylpropionate/trans-cinnamate dioxygenase ferredoxin component